MPRISGTAKRAQALTYLALYLSRDSEFQDLATKLRHEDGKKYSDGIAQIHDRLRLPDAEWVNDYLSELIQHFDEPLRVATMVSHWRPVYEFPPEPASQAPSLLVDPESCSRWEAAGRPLVNSQWAFWPFERPVSTLADLEARSHSPRKARRWWAELGLAKGRQPQETLKRDAYLFYAVRWRGLGPLDTALVWDIGQELALPSVRREALAEERADGLTRLSRL
jgi:hypothetical protein